MTTVEEFFDYLCSQYLNKSMIRYVNMAIFRTDVIDQIYLSIEAIRDAFSKNKVNSLENLEEVNAEMYDKVTKPIYDIPFMFSETSDAIMDDYYISLFNFIKSQAQKYTNL